MTSSSCIRDVALILHADDLGFTHGFNEAIRRAHLEGALTSTCLQVTGFAYREAIREVLPACPDLGVGVHLNLVECKSILPHPVVPALTNSRGAFRGYGPLLRAGWDKRIQRQVRAECRAQIERVLEDGIIPDHLNSHRHAHMLPGFFEIACELAAEYAIKSVRIPEERFHRPRPLRSGSYLLRDANWAKVLLMNALAKRNRPILRRYGLRANDGFAGLTYTAYGSETALRSAIQANLPTATSPIASQCWILEALLHLCVQHHPRDRDLPLPPSVRCYCDSRWRGHEMRAAMKFGSNKTGFGNPLHRANYRTIEEAFPYRESLVIAAPRRR